MITIPVLVPAQAAAWAALLDLAERLPRHWTLIGGQMVHLHCLERGAAPRRPTLDADAVLDVRGDPEILLRVTATLTRLGSSRTGSRPTASSIDGDDTLHLSTSSSHRVSGRACRNAPV